ncbi:MAG: protein kinase domain-containing protein [Chloroflexota bacterium]
MAGTTDSGGWTGRERAGSLTIRRSVDGYHFELDVPAAGGGLRPTIWTGSQTMDDDSLALLGRALDNVTARLEQPFALNAPPGATMVAPSATGQLEQMGRLIYRYVLPEEVQEELRRYTGPLFLATDDASLPWELIHDGREFLALSNAVGRRLVVSGRRRRDESSNAAIGALLIGGATDNPVEQTREIETISQVLHGSIECTVLVGESATKSVVVRALMEHAFHIIHFIGQINLGTATDLERGLVLADGQVLTVAELERTLQGEPFMFINGSPPRESQLEYLGNQTAALASTLASARMRALVGPLWSVYSTGSRLLAGEFYRLIAEGVPAGESLRRARLAVRARIGEELAWSSYVLYGDPNLLVLPEARLPAADIQPGSRFGSLILQEIVGRGGMGLVWRAHQPALERDVAVKLLSLGGQRQDEASRERFQREARIIGRLRHPNVLQVHDFGEEQGFLYLVTEYMPGGTLQDLLKREQMLPVRHAVKLLRPIAEALDYLHRNNVIHRDVKPSNILFSADGRAVIADVGIARLTTESAQMTQTGALLGTPTYISPEQVSGKAAEAPSDQYALGVVLYEALTGRVPFSGSTLVETAIAHVSQPPPPPHEINGALSESTESVILRVLSKDPAARYASCSELIDALEASVEESTSPMSFAAPAFLETTRLETAASPAAPRTTTEQPWLAVGVEDTVASTPSVERPAIGGLDRRLIWSIALVSWAIVAATVLMSGVIQFPWTNTSTSRADPTAIATPPAVAAATAVGQPTLGLAIPKPSTAVPATPSSVAATTVPPAVAEWNETLARLDAGLWNSDLPAAANLLETYLTRYQSQPSSELTAAQGKLFAASVELGQRAIGVNNFGGARTSFKRATELRPNDLLASGELKKVELWIAGDEAYRTGAWATAVEYFGELARIDEKFGNASSKLEASQVELQKTWTPTPVPPTPVPAAPVYPTQAPARAPSGGSSGGGSNAPAPAPTRSILAPR